MMHVCIGANILRTSSLVSFQVVKVQLFYWRAAIFSDYLTSGINADGGHDIVYAVLPQQSIGLFQL